MTTRPHDALFKAAFEAPADAAALVRDIVPAAVRGAVAWETVERQTGSFIDSALADRHSDLLFSARLRTGERLLLYLLLEHQSTPDPAMPLRMLSYQLRIWERVRKDAPGGWLPPVIAVLVRNVPGGWTSARRFEDLFDPDVQALAALADLVPRFSMIVEDLAHLSNDELQARSLAAFQKLALWLLRDARDPRRLLDNFAHWAQALAEVERSRSGIDSLALLVTYLFRIMEPMKLDELRAKIRQLGPRAEEIAMTIAEQLEERGREQGRMEGRLATLRSLLLARFELPALDARYEAALRAASPDALDRYLRRVLSAASLAAVFDD